MRKRRPAKSPARVVVRWLVIAAIMVLGGLAIASIATVAYAAHLEDNDAFCASCHTEPESQFFARSVAAPVDLASAYGAQHVDCIQCHSERGSIGRLTAMASVALPDLLAYQGGHYRSPAVTTVPLGDDHCLRCQADVTRRGDFNNQFRRFLPLWQARDRAHAATCVSCHQGHIVGGDPTIGYLVESTATAICEACHAFAG